MTRNQAVGVLAIVLMAGCQSPETNVASTSSEINFGALQVPPIVIKTPMTPVDDFLVRAYGGQIAKGGGKCLDYTLETTGSPLFLNDCARANRVHIERLPERMGQDGCVRKHEVRILAGSKAIGVRFPKDGSRPPYFELQEPLAISSERSPDDGQTFVLDGDSIIWAASRDTGLNSDSTTTLVAQIENGRGTNGSAIVLGPRRLADSELFEFYAVDGSGRDPGCASRSDETCGFVHVTGVDGLAKYLAQRETTTCSFLAGRPKWPDYDKVIIVEPGPAPTTRPGFLITDGVTIRGDRRGTRLGPEIAQLEHISSVTFATAGNDIRFTGLRLRGPGRDLYADYHAIGIKVHERLLPGHSGEDEFNSRIYVDHNDLSEFTERAVQVSGDDPLSDIDGLGMCRFTESLPPAESRPNRVTVARNFLHHNRVDGEGYGVNASSGGFPLIEGNLFDQNRHAIAATNTTPDTGYRALGNFVLDGAPAYPQGHTHDFDVHGTGEGGRCGDAGSDFDVFWNTFLGDDAEAFELRGFPCRTVNFGYNVSVQSRDDAVNFDLGSVAGWGGCQQPGADPISIWLATDQFNRPDPTKGQKLGVGDFDGDGLHDLFLATGAAFYYSPGGAAEWRLLAWGRTDQMQNLRFGDFDADGRTDVISTNGANMMVSWGGASEWERLGEAPAGMADLAVGNFDGVGADDIFWADGSSWYISYGGSGPYVRLGPSSFRVKNLRFGDFNQNGKTDPMGVVGGAWQYSDGGTVNWAYLGAKRAETETLFVGDFDGDGRHDLARVRFTAPANYTWEYSKSGQLAFAPLFSSTYNSLAAVGRFRGGAQTTVLFWDGDRHLDTAFLGSGGVLPHSRQAMR